MGGDGGTDESCVCPNAHVGPLLAIGVQAPIRTIVP